MKAIVYATLVYFPLIMIYKFIGDYNSHYWVNYYWAVSALYFASIFFNLQRMAILKEYRLVLLGASIYWGVMASLRLYLFFNIGLYSKLISSADKWTIGGVCILILFTYLTAKICLRK